MVSRNYSSVAQPTTLTGNIGSGTSPISVDTPTGYPTPPFTAAIDYGTAAEELVEVTAASLGSWTVTRGVDGTSAQSHSIGATVRHVSSARDFADSRTHEAATAAVHGVAGTLVGTSDAQTLTNKTLTAPAVSNPAVTGGGSLAGTFTGAPTFSGAVVLSGTPSISSGAALSGTFTGSPTLSGNPILSGNPSFTGTPSFPTAAGVLFSRTNVADVTTRTKASADTEDRHQVQADGKHLWGSGSSGTMDTNLYRSGADILQTDDQFAAASLSVAGNASVGGTFSAANMNLGLWGSWTPVWSTSTGLHTPAFGNAVVTGAYTKIGRMLAFSLAVTFGSSTTFGAGVGTGDNWIFSIPGGLTASAAFAGTQNICGYGRATSSATATSPFTVRVDSGGTNFTLDTAGGQAGGGALTNTGGLDSLTPFTWASGHVFSFFGVVETTT